MVPEEHSHDVRHLQAYHSMVAMLQLNQRDQVHLPFVSIIVACRNLDSYVKECIRECLRLDYPLFELIVLPDYEQPVDKDGVRIIPTGPVRPSEKRNTGVELSKGEIIAFIDGDAYPAADWLRKAVRYFDDREVGAVGGPGLTPEQDGVMQKASGEILSSVFGGGPLSFRHSPKTARKCDDIPSVNLIVRRSVFNELGGFNSSFWPGEDTKFCRDLVYGHGKRIVYAPEVRVFHHRRDLFLPHLRQIAGYGFHRGYFSRKFPENSRKPVYFIPSALVIGLPVFLILGSLNSALRNLAIVMSISYLFAVTVAALVAGLRYRNLVLGGAVFLGLVATHFWYGAYFMKGLASGKIDPNSPSYKSNI